MRRFVAASALLLAWALTGASAGEAQVLKPDELCSDYPASATATFTDADLEAAVRAALSIGARDDLTCGLVSGLTAFSSSGPGPERYVSGSPEWPDPVRAFEDLSGIQNLTGLTRLTMNNRWITDISALRGLTNLTVLNLHTNWISDLGPLSGMTSLTRLLLSENPIADISALRDMTELTVLRLHIHGDFIGGQLPRNFLGAGGLFHTNAISDIGPLAGLTKLEDLSIHTHEISDLSPLRGLTSLTELRLAGNPVTDLSPLSEITTLRTLELTGTLVTDLRPLSGLANIDYIDLRYIADLSDIQPLIDNAGIAAGDIVELRFTSVTCADQARLAAKGVEVRTELFSACR
jgi:hypothetical protein